MIGVMLKLIAYFLMWHQIEENGEDIEQKEQTDHDDILLNVSSSSPTMINHRYLYYL